MNFTNVKELTIPEGEVKKIARKSDGVVLWQALSYTNLADPNSADWLDHYRTASTGVVAENNFFITNFIGNGKILYKSIIYYKGFITGTYRINFYNQNKEMIYTAYVSNWDDKKGFDNVSLEGYLNVDGLHETLLNAYYVRLTGLMPYDNPIITIDEPIT